MKVSMEEKLVCNEGKPLEINGGQMKHMHDETVANL